VRTHITVTAVILVSAGTAIAQSQQSVELKVVELQVSDTTRRHVTGFEDALRGAINTAAANLNRRIREAIPDRPIALAFERDTIATGICLPEGGAVFHLLIPAIREIDSRLLNLQQQRALATPATPIGIVTRKPAGPPLIDPDQEYTELTRAALIDAMVDGSLALSPSIPEGKQLTVIAGELQTDPPSPFNPRSQTLILQISGEDLLALRQQKISREEARGRIKLSKY
jgi:hypothetical protein